MADAYARARSTGTDFRDMSVIEVEFVDGNRDPKLSVERLQITSDIPEDPATAAVSHIAAALRTQQGHGVVDKQEGVARLCTHAVLGRYWGTA